MAAKLVEPPLAEVTDQLKHNRAYTLFSQILILLISDLEIFFSPPKRVGST